MKGIVEISKEYQLSVKTLASRILATGVKGTKVKGRIFYNSEQELLIVAKKRVSVSNIRQNINTNLIQTFRLMHPTLVAEEVAYALSIDLERVQIAFKQEYLTLPSKMNRD